MEENLERLGRRAVDTEFCVLLSSAFTACRNIRGGRRSFFLALAAGWRHVSDARKRSIVLWRFDIRLDYPAEINDDIATDGPAGCPITTCFDGYGERVVLTEDDGSGSERAVSEADARVAPKCACDSPADVLSIQGTRHGHGRDLDVAVEHFGVVYEAKRRCRNEAEEQDGSHTWDPLGDRHRRVFQQ